MKSIVIPFKNESAGKLLLELAKKLGLNPRIETKREIEWDFMPEKDRALEDLIEKAEKNFTRGKFLTAEQVKAETRKWNPRKFKV